MHGKKVILSFKLSNKFNNLLQNKLDAFIECPEMLILPQVNLLISASHVSTVQKRAFNVIVAIYKQLYERIHSGDYQNPDQLLSKTPDQVQKMLVGR